MRRKIPVILRFSVVLCILIARSASADTAPDFRAEKLDGGKFHLNDALNDKIILIHFWDTCCPGCREALPAVQKMADEFKDSLKVISVCTDSPKTQSKIRPFFKMNGYSFQVILDPNLEIRKLFGGTESPLTLLVSPAGEILLRRIGASIDEEDILRKEITSQLHKQSNSTPKELETH